MAFTIPASPRTLTLAGPLTAGATVLPLAPADAGALCAALGTDYAIYRIKSPVSDEVVQVSCNCATGVVSVVRALDGGVAQAHPAGSQMCLAADSLAWASRIACLATECPADLPPNNIMDFGVLADPMLDVTESMRAAHATGRTIRYPGRQYKFSGTVTIPSGGIIGDGPTETVLVNDLTGTDDLIVYTGALNGYNNVPTFHNFTLQSNPAKLTGAGIKVLPSIGETSYANFHNVDFVFTPTGIKFVAASLWKVIGCNFLSYRVAGIDVANINSADSGDSAVNSCAFNTPYSTGSGILQRSSGGLKISNNKFLGGGRGYTMSLEASTSVLLISNNSFEQSFQQALVFAQANVGAVFVNACITGNEFSVGDVAIATDASGFLTELVIVGNQINMGAPGSNACISLFTVTDFYVGNNLIKGNGGLGSTAITIGDCVNGKVGLNTYANLPNPLLISNSPTVTVQMDSQSGASVAAAAGWAPYGSMFIGPSVTVPFPQAFRMPPSAADVTFMPGSPGAMTGLVTAITETGFTYNPIATVSGVAVTTYWKSEGVI
jgi:hypothetical protein